MTGLINQKPLHGSLGISNALLVKSGTKESSVLWERMRRKDITRMPPVTSHEVDTSAVDMLGRWIDSGPK